MTYSPKSYDGSHAQDIFSEVLFGNRTVSRNLARVLDNVKFKQTVTSLTGDITFGDYTDYVTEAVLAATSNTLAFADADVAPTQMMALEQFPVSVILGSRFMKDMKAGANNLESPEFEKAILDYVLPRLGEAYERMFWTGITAATKATIAGSSATATQKAWANAQTAGKVDGVIAKAILSGAVLGVAGTTVTASNIASEYDKILAALPDAVMTNADTKLIVPTSDRALILQANSSATYRDKFTVEGLKTDSEKVSYLGVDIEFVNMNGAKARVAGRGGERGDFILATDLLSDLNQVTIAPVNAMSDRLFFKMVATLDTACLVPQQKVLYVS